MIVRTTTTIVLMIVAAIAAPLHAQQTQTLRGRVHAAGVAVAGATVRAVQHDAHTNTAADGTWQLTVLAAGPHEIVIEHIGYATRSVEAPAAALQDLTIELTPKPVSLSSLVVTAGRRTQQLKDVVVSTEVVDAAQLRSTGASDVAAVLAERTGVTLEGGHPVGAGVMLQGLGSERVLVLLDGQPLLGRISGKLDLSRMPVSIVERIEVVKGPQSTLYGSDAMGGVVNVITRAPEDGWRAVADVTSGSRQRLDASASLMRGRNGLGYSIDGAHRTIELVPGLQGDAGTFAIRWDGAAKVQWQANTSTSLFASMYVQDEAQRWKTGALYSFADNSQWTARAGANASAKGVTIASTLYATQFSHLSRRSTRPQPLAGSGEQERQRLTELDVALGGAVGALQIDGGFEARRDAIESDRVQQATRALYAVEPYVQTTFSGSSWSVMPGARVSWSEQWGTHVTPRVAALYRPHPSLALRASAGYGYRAPSFKELYIEFLNTGAGEGYRVRGNAALQPETSRNLMSSVEWAGDRVYARAQLFYNRFDDFIETVELMDSSGLRLFTYGNIDDGMTYGSDIELGTTWRGVRAEGGYGYLVAHDRRNDVSLTGRPRHSARAAVSYAHASGLRATVSGVFTGRTLVARADSADIHRNAFTRFDARVARELPRGFELSAGIDNILDAQPDAWPGFVRRQFHIGVGWRAGNAQ
jgi:outer membrane receptor for ferrienterochelin and colicins